MAENPNKDKSGDSLDSTESLELETEQTSGLVIDPVRVPRTREKLKAKVSGINIYLIIFILIFLLSMVLIFVLWRSSTKESASTDQTFGLEELSQESLDELKNKDTTVGDPKQTLTVSSNSIFNGRVLIRDSLDVAGTINVGGALSLPGITVSGVSNFGEVNIADNLTVGGETSVQGNLNVQQSLTVSGGASFGGTISASSINIQSLSLSNNLSLNGHIDAGGGIPGASAGGSIGSGGTVSASGSDTAGTITINTGSSASAGTLASITFAVAYNQTPHIVITPVGSSAASINYYVTRTTTGFNILAASVPPSNAAIVFDYIAID